MKLEKLIVTDFGGISSLELEMHEKKVLALIGPVGSGKTSILRALRFVHGGKAEAADIRKGARKAVVEVIYEGGHSIKRSCAVSGKTIRTETYVDKRKCTQDQAAQEIKNLLGSSIDTLNAVLSDSFFREVTPKTLASFFLNELPVVLSRDEFIALAEKYVALDPGAKAILESELPDRVSYKDLDTAYEKIYGDRHAKGIEVRTLSSRWGGSQQPPKRSRDEINNDIAAAQAAERDTAVYKAELAAYERADKDRAAAVSMLESLKRQLSDIGPVVKPDPEVLKTNQEERARFATAIEKANDAIRLSQQTISTLEKVLKNVSSNKGICPLAGSGRIACHTDFGPYIREVNEAIIKHRDNVSKHDDYVKRCQAEKDRRQKAIDDWYANERKWEAAQRLNESISKAVIPPEPVKPQCPAAASTKPINELMAELSAWTVYENGQKVYLALDAAQKEHASLDAAVNAVGPGSVRTAMVSAAVKGIEKYVNDHPVRPGFEVSLNEGPSGIEVSVSPKGEFLPLWKISQGEFIATALSLRIAIAAHSGAKLVVVDTIDALDRSLTEGVLKMVLDNPDIENAFIASAYHDDTDAVFTSLGVEKFTPVF